jgi:hypothetical protein
MTSRRDRQRSRLYGWEDAVIGPYAPGAIAFAQAQGMVNAIWAELGLRYPPRVTRLPPRASRILARADRLTLELPESLPAWCLLHELAHALSATAEGASDGHGPVFVGLYIQLLGRYLRFDRAMLLATLEAAGIVVHPDARPVFVERHENPSR